MAQFYDGNYVAGCPVLTLAGGTTYACQSFQTDEDSTTANVLNQNGEPGGAVNFLGFVTGSAQLQCVTSTTTSWPQRASDAGGTSFGIFSFATFTWFIQKVSKPRPQQGIWTFDIDFQRKVN